MTDVKSVTFDMRLQKGDYRRIVYYQIFGKNKFALFGMGFVLAACMVYLVLDLAGGMDMSGWIRFACIVFIILYGVLVAFMESITGKLMKSDLQILGKKRRATVSQDGVIFQAEEKAEPLHFPWTDLYNGAETKSCFLMFSRTGMILFFPKRLLSGEQASQLGRLLRSMMRTQFHGKK